MTQPVLGAPPTGLLSVAVLQGWDAGPSQDDLRWLAERSQLESKRGDSLVQVSSMGTTSCEGHAAGGHSLLMVLSKAEQSQLASPV